ncbi:MAG: flavin reductase [Bacilli bacterium]|nr:flavin reductase [Bacilli bacterium]
MVEFDDIGVKALDHLKRNWALVGAGSIDDFNCCTISWGSFGVLWGKGTVATVYIHPTRYTLGFLEREDYFVISLFPKEYQKALGVLGSLSGRDGDKVSVSGLTPISWKGAVTYGEASISLLCKKLYGGQFDKGGLNEEVNELYRSKPSVYPVDGNGDIQPHYEFIGEVVDVLYGE